MCLLLRAVTMPALKKRITLPAEPYKQTEFYMLITYFIDGHMRFIQVERGEDAAELLYENGIITKYEGSGMRLTMYVNKMHTVTGKGGAPVQWAVETELEWKDIKLYHSDILHMVANWEYEIAGRLMGLIPYKPKAKCRHIETEYNRAA